MHVYTRGSGQTRGVHGMSAPGEVAQIPPVVPWKDCYSMQGHFPAVGRIPFIFVKGGDASLFQG